MARAPLRRAVERARTAWIHHQPLLRRARARAGGVVCAVLRPGRNTLAVLHRGLASVLHRALASPTLRRSSAYVRRCIMGLWRRFRRPGPRSTPPPPPPPPPPPKKKNGMATLHGLDRGRRRRRPAASSTTPSEEKEEEKEKLPTYTVDGEVVPQEVVNRYKQNCTLPCAPKNVVCHFCVHEWQRSRNFTVPTGEVIMHSSKYHADEQLPAVPCEEPGCKVRTRPGRDQAWHVYFCHRLPHGWWV